jgi:hypothetical protein
MIASILSAFTPYLIAIGAALAALVAAYVKGRGDGKAKATEAELKRDVSSLEDQLEMHREATQIERDIASMTDDEAKAEAQKWVKR